MKKKQEVIVLTKVDLLTEKERDKKLELLRSVNSNVFPLSILDDESIKNFQFAILNLIMGRSSKKGPFIDPKLLKKVMAQKVGGAKSPIKTWARRSQIPPEFVGHTFLVHQGKNFVTVFVSESMVGQRLGEFAPTRIFRGHGKVTEKSTSKT